MPAIVGSIQIVTVGGGVVNFGDTLNISPKSVGKENTGSGSGNIGTFVVTNNGFNAVNAFDPDVVDQPQTSNQ